jgi:hypothetical protein
MALALLWLACAPAAVAAAAAPTTGHPAVAREMAGVWLPDGRNSGRLPQQWPLREQARAAQQRWLEVHGPVDPGLDDANASCIPESMPYPVRLIAQYPFELLFTRQRVTMFFEIFGNIRRIPLDAPTPAHEHLPTAMGSSTGHWEGDVLVIETTSIRRDGAGAPTGNPPVSNARRITERWSLGRDAAGAKQLRNEITIHDPVVLTGPVSLRMLYKWSPDIEVGEYLCQQDIWDQNLQGSPSTVPWRQ